MFIYVVCKHGTKYFSKNFRISLMSNLNFMFESQYTTMKKSQKITRSLILIKKLILEI